jgi:hypothetical protein
MAGKRHVMCELAFTVTRIRLQKLQIIFTLLLTNRHLYGGNSITPAHNYLLHGLLVTRKTKVLMTGRLVSPLVYIKVVP